MTAKPFFQGVPSLPFPLPGTRVPILPYPLWRTLSCLARDRVQQASTGRIWKHAKAFLHIEHLSHGTTSSHPSQVAGMNLTMAATELFRSTDTAHLGQMRAAARMARTCSAFCTRHRFSCTGCSS